jgi:ferrous iron transport protein C
MSILDQVLREVSAGTPTVAAVATRTGLDPGVVGLALDRLVASGRLVAEPLAPGCPSGGCGTCPAASGCAPGPARRGGGVLLTLAARRS